MKNIKNIIGLCLGILPFVILMAPVLSPARAEDLSFSADFPDVAIDLPFPEADYKTVRMREIADIWKGTSLEPHTTKLLAMLLVEDGTLTAERRHDCHKGVCYAIGIQGHHICHRGTPIVSQRAGKPFQKFCGWKDGKSAQERFEKEYPGFSFDWRVQVAEYTVRMTDCIDSGKTINACIQLWNSREAGRLNKVAARENIVREALD